MNRRPLGLSPDKALTLLVIVLAVAVGTALLFGASECRKVGGQYVRGLFWMECIR